MQKQVVLIILDGWGHREETNNNAIAKSKTPFFDHLWKNYPHSLLMAGGEHVGLPDGQVGNSEIGHMTIGAGQVIDTDLVRITKSIKTGEFDKNPVFEKAFMHTEKGGTLHLMGLFGSGGVHAHEDHLFALINLAKKKGVKKVALHLFTDGRDSGPSDSIKSFEKLSSILDENIFVSTISGRYFAMDRDNNWDRLDKFLKLIEKDGEARDIKNNLIDVIKKYHKDGVSDEHIEPFVVKSAPISNGDSVIIFNFRADRARMLCQKLLEQKKSKDLFIVNLTEYNKDFDVEIAFPQKDLETVLANEISKAGLSQAHIAETEKFPHATYFLNGGREEPHEKEEHVLLASRKDVKTHDEAPEMRAEAIADEAIKRIESGVNFIFINFANPDMVGHTANVPAIVKAVETVDAQLERVIKKIQEKGGVAIVTADHGNAETNIDEITGDKHTAHTLNPVPCILISEINKKVQMKNGTLADIAPTVLALFDIQKPESMTGSILFN